MYFAYVLYSRFKRLVTGNGNTINLLANTAGLVELKQEIYEKESR